MRKILSVLVVLLISACGKDNIVVVPEPIAIASSIKDLPQRFEWARTTALSYAHDGADSVGLWYEAALPGRDAFCMRDVSHQALGAHFIGLDEHTRNMLFQFARNISEGKDWCSFWEITKNGVPAPVDYRNDEEFWYNLPSNFDVLDASYRMYQWTGDPTYIEHPAFLTFYENTVTDYVETWDLGAENVLTRSRYMNRDSFDLADPYQYVRGIPSYNESHVGSVRVGIDLLAFQVAAYRSYAAVLQKNGQPSKSEEMLSRAVRASNLISEAFWKEDVGHFSDMLMENGQTTMGGGMQTYLLYNDAISDLSKAKLVASNVASSDPGNIEMQSYVPEVLYRYGLHGEALDMLMRISADSTDRRTYPEVSFSVIGALATGLMGLSPIDKGLASISRISTEDDWVELKNVPHLKSIISLKHTGTSSSTFTVLSGEKLIWRAVFAGSGTDPVAFTEQNQH